MIFSVNGNTSGPSSHEDATTSGADENLFLNENSEFSSDKKIAESPFEGSAYLFI